MIVQPLWFSEDFDPYLHNGSLAHIKLTWINEVWFLTNGETIHLMDVHPDVSPVNGGLDVLSDFAVLPDDNSFIYVQVRAIESNQFEIDGINSLLYHHAENEWQHAEDLADYHPLLDNWREIALA